MIEFLRNIGILEARSRLPEICSEVAATGQTVIISRHGQPMVEVRPLTKTAPVPVTLETEWVGPVEGVLERHAKCVRRFGELETEFVMPKWPPRDRILSRDCFEDYWTQPRA